MNRTSFALRSMILTQIAALPVAIALAAPTEALAATDPAEPVPEVGQKIENFDPERYELVRDPGAFGLEPYGTYYTVEDELIRVDRTQMRVIANLGEVEGPLEVTYE